MLAILTAGILQARDLADYRVGDRAEADITATVPLDVIDPVATATRQAAEMLKVPAIFRSYPAAMTNALAKAFSGDFTTERAGFLAALNDTFHRSVLEEATIGSPVFEAFLAGFNRRENPFPVSPELAGLWALADSGSTIENQWLRSLLDMTHRVIRPDDLPAGLVLGETIRLVPVASARDAVTPDDVERDGSLITQSSLITITRLRGRFLQSFADDQQNPARALQHYLQPNCVADAGLTQAARAREVSQLVAVAHYDAGQILVHRGELIDAKAAAALAQLDDKLASVRLNSQIAAERAAAQQARQAQQEQQALAQAEKRTFEEADMQHQQMQQRVQQIQMAQDRKLKALTQELASQTLAARARNEWSWVALAGIASTALLAAWWLVRSRRRAPAPAAGTEALPAQNHAALQIALAPQIAAVLKDAMLQGLAAQRNELLQVQQAAAAEISGLVRRLDKIQAPIQERLWIYELRIKELEKELSLRSEENHELLKVKIEMIRSQLATERAHPPETPGQFRYASSLRGKPFS